MLEIPKLLKRPIEDEQWIAKVVIGGIVSLIPVLQFCAAGYLVNLIRKTLKGDDGNLPEWNNWGKMFTDGILYFVIAALFFLIPFLIFVGAFMPAPGFLRFIAGTFSLLVSAAAAIAASFVIPAAVCSFVDRENFNSAFDFKYLQERIKLAGNDYLMAYLLMLGLVIAAYMVSLFLGILIIGWVLAPFIFFYLHLVAANMFARVYRESKRPEPAEEGR